jgi:hypothetical protein
MRIHIQPVIEFALNNYKAEKQFQVNLVLTDECQRQVETFEGGCVVHLQLRPKSSV